MTDDERFDEFLERYCATGDAEVPSSWPAALRDRCLFFARMLEGSQASGSLSAAGRSLASLLEERGVPAGLSLADPGGPAAVAPRGGPERYVIERELAAGGMGRILLAYDRDFRRRIALKVLREPTRSPGRISRFVEEAQATAQLEHPHIAPAYDIGLDPAGNPFFTMKWIRGRNLDEIIAARDPEFSLVRLVQVLQQAAMGVHFANSRGVIHRDLKPQNVMVGDYGEVMVVDWGLAKVLRPAAPGSAAAAGGSEAPISTERADQGLLTIEGSVHGSPAYMSPEQALGNVTEVDARTDVFGLGAILYAVLTGSALYPESSTQAALGRARLGKIAPLRERAAGRSLPPALAAACEKALAFRREDRFASAREFHEELQRFIEGIHDVERRTAEARRLLAAAQALRADLGRAREEGAEAEQRAAELAARIAGDAPESAKQPLWDASAEAQAAEGRAAALFNQVTAAYAAVLSIQADDPGARAALAELYLERLLAAEERGDREAASLHEGFTRQYGDERLRGELDGPVPLRLESEPPGAEVLLSRYEERGPLLVESAAGSAGRTPLDLRLPRGSYLARLRLAGHVEARYPFLLERRGAVEALVRLRREGSIPEGFIQVPAGVSIVGGEPRDYASLPRRREHIDEVFVARFPVTLGEYCEFLNEEFAAERPDLDDHLPFFGTQQYVVKEPGGLFVPSARVESRVPAIALPIAATMAYLEWLGRKIGKQVRLLEEVEWERCARGADGRLYPWGNGFDWAFAKGRDSRPGEPHPEAVGSFARDVSPFGIRDLAGGVRELCAGSFGQGSRPLRGGSWFNGFAFVFRADSRTPRTEGTRTTDAGFRVCYDERGPG